MIDVDAIWPALLECRAWMKEASPGAAGRWEFTRTASGEWSFAAKTNPLPSAPARSRGRAG